MPHTVEDPSPLATVLAGLADAFALMLPVTCAGCGSPDRALCRDCAVALEPDVRELDRAGLRCWAALEYGGVVASAVGAYKDAGRTDAGLPLAAALRAAVSAALRVVGPGAAVELCGIPSTPAARRARGYDPVPRLLNRASLRAARVLRLARAREDQAELGVEERRVNAHGALAARGELRGRRFLIVDDVLTTGATVAEAARALHEGGGQVVGAAVIAQTPRRTPPPTRMSKPA